MFYENILVKQFQDKVKNVDQIAQWAIEKKQKKISEKYRNIESTAKILKGLINQFTKRSLKFEEQLRQSARIQDLEYQTQYHRSKVKDCLALSQTLEVAIEKKRAELQVVETEARQARQDLILIKTENIKKILKIEMLEQIRDSKLQKENQEQKKIRARNKIEAKRVMLKTGTIQGCIPSKFELMKRQETEVSKLLWGKINRKVNICQQLSLSYETLKDHLIKQERKSNVHGLAGSLLFKLVQNQNEAGRIGPIIARKNKGDQKLLIYDVLKQRHSNQIKQEKDIEDELIVSREKFMGFSPIQILGLIELKGGMNYLRNGQQLQSNTIGPNEIFDQVKCPTIPVKTFYKTKSQNLNTCSTDNSSSAIIVAIK